jgi:DNA end-binding protein Ku
MVRIYEYEEGRYIVIDKEDFIQKSKTIEIQQFALLDEIEFVFFEKPYYLEPAKGAEKAYTLLREVLRASKKVAIVRFVLHNKGHLGILKEYKNVIILDHKKVS